MTSWRWHSSLHPWLSFSLTKPTSSQHQELWPNTAPRLAPCTKASPAQSSTVQSKARLTGEFQLNSISPLASVAAAWAVATQKAKFHIERENPLISWPLLPYEWSRNPNGTGSTEGATGVSLSRQNGSFWECLVYLLTFAESTNLSLHGSLRWAYMHGCHPKVIWRGCYSCSLFWSFETNPATLLISLPPTLGLSTLSILGH